MIFSLNVFLYLCFAVSHANGGSARYRMVFFRKHHNLQIRNAELNMTHLKSEKAAKNQQGIPATNSPNVNVTQNPSLKDLKIKIIHSKICNATTCAKCVKVMSKSNPSTNRKLEKHCYHLFRLSQCCKAQSFMVRGGF